MMQLTGIINCKTHTAEDHRSDSVNTLDSFRSSANIEADKEPSRSIIPKIHSKCSDVFTGIGYFKRTFKLRVKKDIHPYQTPPRRVTYALQQPHKEEPDR